MTSDLERARNLAAESEKDAKEARNLREEIVRLNKEKERDKRELEELAPLRDTTEGRVLQDLVRTRYAAYIGWGCSVFLGLALAYSYFLQKPPEEPATDDTERPPHHIV